MHTCTKYLVNWIYIVLEKCEYNFIRMIVESHSGDSEIAKCFL